MGFQGLNPGWMHARQAPSCYTIITPAQDVFLIPRNKKFPIPMSWTYKPLLYYSDFFLFFGFWATTSSLRGYSWQAQEPLGMPGIEPGPIPGQQCARQTLYRCAITPTPTTVIFKVFFVLGHTPSGAQMVFQLCTQKLLLAHLGSQGMLGIELRSTACRTHALPTVLSLQPLVSILDLLGG